MQLQGLVNLNSEGQAARLETQAGIDVVILKLNFFSRKPVFALR
jgi:hypothetical protein